jgi:hypothetical protein
MPAADQSPIDVASAENALVEYWNRLWVAADASGIDQILSDPFVTHGPDGTTSRSPAVQAAHVLAVTEHLRGTSVVFDLLDAIDDRLHARFTLHGVNLRSGQTVTVATLGQYRLEQGRLAEAWILRETGFAWT